MKSDITRDITTTLLRHYYDINREARKKSDLLSDKIDKYEYLTGEEILSSNQ